jgi:hypothetical protein
MWHAGMVSASGTAPVRPVRWTAEPL